MTLELHAELMTLSASSSKPNPNSWLQLNPRSRTSARTQQQQYNTPTQNTTRSTTSYPLLLPNNPLRSALPLQLQPLAAHQLPLQPLEGSRRVGRHSEAVEVQERLVNPRRARLESLLREHSEEAARLAEGGLEHSVVVVAELVHLDRVAEVPVPVLSEHRQAADLARAASGR